MDLARRIISDFHSPAEAARAAEEWQRVVGAGEIPADIETVTLDNGAIRIDKLLAKVALAESVSDATRKIKAGAVEVNGARVSDLVQLEFPGQYTIRVGKKWKRVAS
jgi:tyrosyl-tRNA synthetase